MLHLLKLIICATLLSNKVRVLCREKEREMERGREREKERERWRK